MKAGKHFHRSSGCSRWWLEVFLSTLKYIGAKMQFDRTYCCWNRWLLGQILFLNLISKCVLRSFLVEGWRLHADDPDLMVSSVVLRAEKKKHCGLKYRFDGEHPSSVSPSVLTGTKPSLHRASWITEICPDITSAPHNLQPSDRFTLYNQSRVQLLTKGCSYTQKNILLCFVSKYWVRQLFWSEAADFKSVTY